MSHRPDDYTAYLRELRSLDDLPARISQERKEADERLRATREAAQQRHADLEASADRLRQQVDQLLARGRTMLEPVDRQGLVPSKVRAKGEPGELATAEQALVSLQGTVHKLEEHRQAARERRLAEAKAREVAAEEEARQRRQAEEQRRAEAERRAEQARKRSRVAAALGAVLTVAAGAIASLQAPTVGVIVLVIGAIATAGAYLLLQREGLEDPNDDNHHRPGGQ
jgi:septal ring factor EnvC (AmiA/AmiB activator)